ncbi:DMT family transporter [Streptomyces sp. ActVer]|uniref:DMT family transporter n=1 Tax=Streptomyces sp. ActVer TaxID=3014558 RepID=UPI0022B57C3C|nr:DMT family transporter [Streptomyces sp. ActVer]MCZ4514489.1 DMT family transporter [Streptomyces sp. ActVer]
MKSRIDPLSIAAMAVAVVSISATAPLTAAATASPLAMAFWRNALGFATLGPFLLILRRREVVRVARGERGLLRREQWRPMVFGFLAATALALHFAAFMTSTQLTSVAMSTALVATQPVWQALIATGQGVRASRRTWAGLTLAVIGAAAAAGVDIQSGSRTALLGDLLALAGAVAQAGYAALSEKSRADVSTPLYSTVTSLVCGLELLAACWLFDIPLTGFDRTTQLSLLGLLILPQLLGLGALNFVLGRTSATTMSVLLLLETPVAALMAWSLMDQGVAAATVPGLLLIIVGVTVVVTSDSGGKPAPREDELRGPHELRRQDEQRRQDTYGPGAPPYPAYAPHPSQLPPAVGVSTVGEPADNTPAHAVAAWAAFETGQPTTPRPTTARPTTPRHAPLRPNARRDPRVDWARRPYDESPTIQLSYHGAGAFDTMFLGGRPPEEPRRHPEEPRPGFEGAQGS